jgi:prevent-host-death family protein
MTTSSTIPAGKFKAQCLKLMDVVHDKHIAITITKRGKPVAKLTPIDDQEPHDFFGCMQDTVMIEGDIVAPIDEIWDADK